jgi:undecaprenyl-phosphate galactose phosphotransferase
MSRKILSFLILAVADLFVIIFSFLLAYELRSAVLPSLIDAFKKVPTYPLSKSADLYFLAFTWILIFAYEKLYTKHYPLWDEVRVLVKSATLSSFLVMVVIFITRKERQVSRTAVVLAWLVSIFLFPGVRFLTKRLLFRLGLWKRKVLILGANETGALIQKDISLSTTMGYEAVGVLDDDPKKQGGSWGQMRVLGRISDLPRVVSEYHLKDIIIALPDVPGQGLRRLLKDCEKVGGSIWLVPQSGDLINTGVEIDNLGQILTLHLKNNLEKPWNILLKSLFERALAALALLLLSPLFVVLSVAIKIDSKGPVLFVQKRVGQGQRLFGLYKFRSMHVDNKLRLARYLGSNPGAQQELDQFRKLKNGDPRITRVGKLIRKHSLDELPQLINVLVGQMSVVGPRPYLLEELQDKEAFMNHVSRVKPGITGLWQISGRSELTFEERIALDEHYVRNWSLWLDIIILVRTFKVLFSSKGAY